MPSATDWVLASRPKTLGAAVAPVVVGTALAWKLTHTWHPWLAVCTLLSSCAIQVATNWFNDALDFMKGADTDRRIGPRRITASGVASPKAVMRAALAALIVAMLLSLPLIVERGWPIIAIGLPSLYFSFGYTGGPWPLAYRGMGELFVMLFFGLVAVTGSCFVQTGTWELSTLRAGIQVGCLSTTLIAINNLRDRAEDTLSNKRTLAVRFGEEFARYEIIVLHGVAYGLGAAWPVPLAMIPGAVICIQIMRGVDGPPLSRLLAAAGAQLLLFATLFAVWCVRS